MYKLRKILLKIPRPLLLAISLGIIVRLIGLYWVLVINQGPEALIFGDGIGYMELAKNLKNGLGFIVIRPEGIIPETLRTPGLPVLLMSVVGSQMALIIYFIAQSILASIILPTFVWLLGNKLFNRPTANIAAFLMALELNNIFFSWFPLSEIPYLIFMLISVYLMFRLKTKVSAAGIILTALFAAGAIMIKPGTLLFFLILTGLLFLTELKPLIRKTFAPLLVFLVILIFLSPYLVYIKSITGVYSLSSTAWRNAYTNYVATIYAVEKGTDWTAEKNQLKTDVIKLGLPSRYDVDNPAYSHILRDFSIQEIKTHFRTVLKLEPLLILNFFTQDGYYYALRKLNLVEPTQNLISPTALFLDKGVWAFPKILSQLKDQLFIPILGRIFTVLILLLALIGSLIIRNKTTLIFILLTSFTALASTVLGYNTEGRLRMVINPFLFLLAAAGINFLYQKFKRT